ncbi:hypothetical protein H5410_037547 [Solanum commersonii]|uniref:Acetyl-CoA carboxytransferase n=1 Tax=Solanum commersonii TaxID=4109 RepID=A0A9J5Y6K3_SOLCO|nr:hypothetical protein H5410_037547 [Solanum commersonii]
MGKTIILYKEKSKNDLLGHYNDAAIVSDIGSIEGRGYLLIGEPISPNLRAMFELRVPIITIVTNKGGSGKTLAVGCANKWLILENSAFYVARHVTV